MGDEEKGLQAWAASSCPAAEGRPCSRPPRETPHVPELHSSSVQVNLAQGEQVTRPERPLELLHALPPHPARLPKGAREANVRSTHQPWNCPARMKRSPSTTRRAAASVSATASSAVVSVSTPTQGGHSRRGGRLCSSRGLAAHEEGQNSCSQLIPGIAAQCHKAIMVVRLCWHACYSGRLCTHRGCCRRVCRAALLPELPHCYSLHRPTKPSQRLPASAQQGGLACRAACNPGMNTESIPGSRVASQLPSRHCCAALSPTA